MKTIECYSVGEAVVSGVRLLLSEGVLSTSRNGTTLTLQEPASTRYADPRDRVLLCPVRDANPFFHFFEGLWMLAGRCDVEFLAQFNPRMREFSDDNKTLHGAYGNRWRHKLGFDQLPQLISELRRDPTSRRAVLSMWSPFWDLQRLEGAKDVPCNTHIYFDLRGGCLNMQVCNRSNDIIWGAYGANFVHMTMLQEYVAAQLRADVGWYEQTSFNYHLYPDNPGVRKFIEHLKADPTIHKLETAANLELVSNPATFDAELELAFRKGFNISEMRGSRACYNAVFADTAWPMYQAWQLWQSKDLRALDAANNIVDPAWRQACYEWLARRLLKESSNA
jgi:hypothetical protein